MELISSKEVCKILDICDTTLWQWRKMDPTPLKFVKIKSRYMYDKKQIKDLINQREVRRLLKLNSSQLQGIRKQKSLKFKKIGGDYFYDKKQVESLKNWESLSN